MRKRVSGGVRGGEIGGVRCEEEGELRGEM